MKRLILFSFVLTLCATGLCIDDDEEAGGFDEMYQLYKGKAPKRRQNDAQKFEKKFGRKRVPLANEVRAVAEPDLPEQDQGRNYAAEARESPEVVDNFRYHEVQRHGRQTQAHRRGKARTSHLSHPPVFQVVPYVQLVPVIIVFFCNALRPGFKSV